MTLLLKTASEPAAAWISEFSQLLPDMQVRVWPEIGDPEEITYALVSKPPFGALAALPNLRLITSLLVGLDHLLDDPDLPADVPVVRCVSPGGDPMMTEFVLMHVLRHHRQLPAYLQQQRDQVWQPQLQPMAEERRVGILGLGTFGRAAATAISHLGFDVMGCARNPAPLEGVRTFSGGERDEMIRQSDILVSMLPDTPQTQGVLCRETLDLLPQGASVINVGRGSAVIEDDLLSWLDADPSASASLDVAQHEPLSTGSALWKHPRVTLTPHVASLVKARRAAAVVAENIRRLEAHEPLLNRVDRSAGY